MAIARSRVTAQGQVSVPSKVRKKLGVGPGSVLEWDENGHSIVVRRAGAFTFEDIHRKIFKGRKSKARTIEEMKEGIRQHIRDRHARD
jgi:AbrB family looped-hinge helix DNA binding protein